MHLLHVLSYGRGVQGIVESTPLQLEKFQTHGMRCTETQVELIGWEFVYLVDLADRRRPWLARKISRPGPGATVPGADGTNLAYWSRPGVTEPAIPQTRGCSADRVLIWHEWFAKGSSTRRGSLRHGQLVFNESTTNP